MLKEYEYIYRKISNPKVKHMERFSNSDKFERDISSATCQDDKIY